MEHIYVGSLLVTIIAVTPRSQLHLGPTHTLDMEHVTIGSLVIGFLCVRKASSPGCLIQYLHIPES